VSVGEVKIRAIAGSGAMDVLAVGDAGRIFRFSGAN